MYTIEDVNNAYKEYQMYKALTEEKKKTFNLIADEVYGRGERDISDETYLSKTERSNDKYDVVMLKTIHPEIYNSLVESGNVSIKMDALKDYAVEIEDCLVKGEKTVFYTIKEKKDTGKW